MSLYWEFPWKEMGLKQTFPLISNLHVYVRYRGDVWASRGESDRRDF